MVVKAATELLAPVGKRHLSKPARIPPKRGSEGKLTEAGDSGLGPSVSRVPVHSPLPGASDAPSTSEIGQGSVWAACLPPQAQEFLGQRDSKHKEHQEKGPFSGGQRGGEGRGFAVCSADSKGVRDTQGTQPPRQDDAWPSKGTEDGTRDTRNPCERAGLGALAFTGVLSRSPSTVGVRNPSTCGSGPPPCPKPTKSSFGTDKLVTNDATEPQAERCPGWGASRAPPPAHCGRKFAHSSTGAVRATARPLPPRQRGG